MNVRVVFLLLTLLITLCVSVFFRYFESYEKTEESGWSVKAWRNPMLAAQQYLEQLGVERVDTTNRLESLGNLNGYDSVFISNARHIVSERQTENLLNWVDRGGHLVVAMGPVSEDEHPLLDVFSVTLDSNYYDDECGCEEEDEDYPEEGEDNSEDEEDSEEITPQKTLSERMREHNEKVFAKREGTDSLDPEERTVEESPEEESQGPETAADSEAGENQTGDGIVEDWEVTEEDENDGMVRLTFSDIEETLVIDFNTYRTIEHPWLYEDDDVNEYDIDYRKPSYWKGADGAVSFMQFDYGDGVVTFISNNIWSNWEIEEHDHAYLLWLFAPERNGMLLLYGTTMPSLWDLLWRHFPEFTLGAWVLLALWLFYRIKRFGPIRSIDVTQRRSLEEHLSMSGRYYWKEKCFDHLVGPLRKMILRQAPLNNLSEKECILYLHERCGIEANEIKYALYDNLDLNEEQLTRVISNLQTIRKAL